MTNLTWPANIFPRSTGFESIPNAWAFRNGETGTGTVYEQPGHRWRQQVTLPDLSGDERIEFQVFLLKLRGQINRVLLPDFAHRRRGVGGGTPLVMGGSQAGRTLTIDGCPASITWLRLGDYFQLPNYELFRLTADAVTNSSGVVTLQFEPAIRVPPADNAPVEISNPRSRCMLNTRSTSWTNIAEPLNGFDVRSSFTLDFIEIYP